MNFFKRYAWALILGPIFVLIPFSIQNQNNNQEGEYAFYPEKCDIVLTTSITDPQDLLRTAGTKLICFSHDRRYLSSVMLIEKEGQEILIQGYWPKTGEIRDSKYLIAGGGKVSPAGELTQVEKLVMDKEMRKRLKPLFKPR